MNGDFKTHHFDVIAAIDEKDDDAHAAEQAVIDKYDEEVDALTVQLQTLLTVLTSPDVSEEQLLLRRLRHIKETLDSTTEAIDGLPSDSDDPALIQAYEEELSSLKEQITLCYNDLCGHYELGEKDELLDLYSEIKKIQFDCCHKVKKMLHPRNTAATEAKALKVPKLEAPTFDGNILNWTHFWEQFSISIDSKSNLSDAEKFVYLQNSLRGGSAKNVIEVLSGTGENYTKAIECLK